MTSTVIILAIHYPGFQRMQCQMALGKPLFQRCEQLLGLHLRSPVANGIDCIALKRNAGKLLAHPSIKHIVQKQIAQQGTYYTALRRAFVACQLAPAFQLHRSREPSLNVQQ